MPITIYRYLAKQILFPFFMGLMVFTGILLLGRILKIADMVVSRGVSLKDVALLIIYLLPNFAVITIPMSLLLAIMLAFSRLSADSEIIAIKASGISLYKLLPPALVLAVAAYLLTAGTAVYAMPKGNVAFKELLYIVLQSRLNLNLKEQVFNNSIPGMTVYIDRNTEKDGGMSGILIHDERNPQNASTIFARTGSLGSDGTGNKLTLHLADGSIHQSRPHGVYRSLQFKEYELLIDLSKGLSSFERNEQEMSIAEIRQSLDQERFSKKQKTEMKLEIQRRFAIPFACFIFTLVAIPLGIQNRRSGKAAGFSLSIITLLVFYIFQSIGKNMGEKAILTPFLAMWLPNFIFLAGGALLFIMAARENQFDLLRLFSTSTRRIFRGHGRK